MKHADIIVPLKEYNENAVEMLVSNLKIKMRLIDQTEYDGPNTPITKAVRSELRDSMQQTDKLIVPEARKQIKYQGLMQLTYALLNSES